MPLEKYQRGRTWWVKGRCDGVVGYVRESLGTPDEAVADAKIWEIEKKARQRAILGSDAPKPADELTFAGAILLYEAKPAEARYLAKLLGKFGNQKIKDISGLIVKRLARQLYPVAATDTWQRQVISPVRAVINNAHELGACAPIRIKAYTRNERMEQDRNRGKLSRQDRVPSDWEWIEAFRAAAINKRNPYIAALALFMFTTGARISQSTALTPNDLDLSKARVFLPAAKGHQAQWVTISTQMVVDLANLPARRGKVFGYATRHSVMGAWHTVCDKAGIEHITPHAAGRHGFGTEMLIRQNLDPVTTAKAGRWSSPRVPLEFYSHAENVDAKVQMALENGRSRTKSVQSDSKNASK